jgi:uncharacterized membrane protein YdjX (TVP38/TMEM64 family)
MKKPLLLRIAVLFVLVDVIAALAIFHQPVAVYVAQFLDWVQELGPWGPIVVVAAYILACVFCVPGSLVTLGAGFVFGVLLGTVTVSIGSTLGAAAAFLVGRFLARDWIEGRVATNPRFRAIDQAVGEQGFKIVLLTRLSPIFPFNLLNYGYGLTRVRFWDYLLASWIGMLPFTVVYVYLGSLAGNLAALSASKEEHKTTNLVVLGIGLVIAVVVAVVIGRIAKKALDRAIVETGNEQQAAGSESPP